MTGASTRKLHDCSVKEDIQETSLRRSKRCTYIPIIDISSSDTDEDLHLIKNNQLSPRKQKHNGEENKEVTPSKQKRSNENAACLTPSTLLDNLALTSPRKQPPKSNGKLERKQLFAGNSLYRNARKALNNTLPSNLPGREKEINELRHFIQSHLNSQTSSSMYISGPPGTGKTACLNLILQQEDVCSNFQNCVYINCTAIKSSRSIYSKISKELGLKVKNKTEKEYLSVIERFLSKPHKMILLVLDEIDQLETKNQSILYSIFEWPAIPSSKIILIGIANALDLTERILPRLQARCELKPKLMHFASYTNKQLHEILASRLKEANATEIFRPEALQLLTRKVAAVSGDVRRALDLGRRAIELGEQRALKSLENVTKNERKSVEIKHIADALSAVYSTSQHLNEEADDSLPLQQKIIVCVLLLVLKKARNKDVMTVGKLHEVYTKVCKKQNVLGVDQAEFGGLCALLETRGIVKVTGKKEPRLNKVSLQWDEEEVVEALKDKQLMSTILQDDSCLGKL